MIIYLLQITVSWGIFALFYHGLLRKETFFAANRGYLLLTLVLGLALPLAADLIPGQQGLAGLPVLTLPDFTVNGNSAAVAQWHWSTFFKIVYFTGFALAFARLFWGLFRLSRLVQQSTTERMPDGCLLVRTPAAQLPFSFFHWIFIPANHESDAQDRHAMLLHERAHAHSRHSFDVLLAELVCVVCWFHPLAHWYRRSLRTVHEYQADAAASSQSNLKQYGLLLIRQAQPGMSLALVNHFFQSPLKMRLIMLTKHPSKQWRQIKYALVLPLFVLIALFSDIQPVQAQTEDPAIELFDLDQKPVFPGGEQAMMQYLSTNIKYPEEARKNKIEGMAVITFVIGKDGTVGSVKSVKNDINAQLIEEAIRVVSSMPTWTPGQKGGKAVRVKYTLPIKFKLS